jgi:hypothetical protein
MTRTLVATCLMSLAVGAVATSADADARFETATFTGIGTGENIERHAISALPLPWAKRRKSPQSSGGPAGNSTVESPNFLTDFQFEGDGNSWEDACLDEARINVAGVPAST